MQTLREMFVYELQQMYYIETELVDVLQELASETEDEKIRTGFEDHRGETRDQVERIERVFEVLNEPAETRRSNVFDGLLEDRREFASEARGEQDLIDMYHLGAGMKTERLEITAYEALLTHADKLDLPNEARVPLERNLDEEKSTLRELKGMAEGSALQALIGRITG